MLKCNHSVNSHRIHIYQIIRCLLLCTSKNKVMVNSFVVKDKLRERKGLELTSNLDLGIWKGCQIKIKKLNV